jgi:hypothetical protein
MPSPWNARIRRWHNSVIAVAVFVGLGAANPPHVQEHRLTAPELPVPEDHTIPAANRGERYRKQKARLFAQETATLTAELAYKNASLARNISEISIREYVECTFRQELAEIEREIKLAESSIVRLIRVRENAYKGFPPDTRLSDELSLKRAKFVLAQAQSKRKVLVDYTKFRRANLLKTEFDKALAIELKRKAEWEMEASTQCALEREMAHWQVIQVKVGRSTTGSSSRVAFSL